MMAVRTSVVRGRFAPSPTGRMHLGNIYAALLSWLAAKSQNGQWILRIEDIDPQRSRNEYALQIEDDLRWMGLVWDEGGTSGGPHAPYRQSLRRELYAGCYQRLEQQGLVYPCFCKRADLLQATQAPHIGEGVEVYPGTCRHLTPAEQAQKCCAKQPSYRIQVADEEVMVADGHYGSCTVDMARACGDFVIKRADGAFAYQLAVVADDIAMGINQVVRGRDLFPEATARQIYLYRLLGAEPPAFFHIPLLVGQGGTRLCKRDASMDMGVLRENYPFPEQIIGILGYMAGFIDRPESIGLQELVGEFSWGKLVKHDIDAYQFVK